MSGQKLANLQDKIGYHFQNKNLLQNALTHSSYANEKHMKKLWRLFLIVSSQLNHSIYLIKRPTILMFFTDYFILTPQM